MHEEEEIRYSEVYRSLSSNVYIINFVIQLTRAELMMCLIAGVLTGQAIWTMGIGRTLYFGFFSLDPMGPFLVGILMAVLFTIGHQINPDGTVDHIPKGWLAPKLLHTRPGDRFWLPASCRYYPNNITNKKYK